MAYISARDKEHAISKARRKGSFVLSSIKLMGKTKVGTNLYSVKIKKNIPPSKARKLIGKRI